MKVLYCNPSFWEYRLPFYAELNRLFNGNFHVVYSTKRYFGAHVNMLPKIKNVLGENAHPYENEWMYVRETHSMKIKDETYHAIPLSLGLLNIIRKIKPDVLITEGFFQWTPFVQLYGWFFRVPVFVGYERTLYTERHNSRFKTFLRKLQDKSIAGYLVNGIETKKYLLSLGISEDKIFVGGMSADSTGLRTSIKKWSIEEKQNFKNKYISSNNGLIFLFTGQMILRKGVNYLLKAWVKHTQLYPDDKLVLVGGGVFLEKWKEQYSKYSSIIFEGAVAYDEIYKYYAIADVYILPTIEDNWSLVVPEAMACGLPVATSIYNGCHVELIQDGENGFVFDTFNQESITNVLAKFHHMDLKKMGAKSILIEKNFNTEACAKREYEAILKTLNL